MKTRQTNDQFLASLVKNTSNPFVAGVIFEAISRYVGPVTENAEASAQQITEKTNGFVNGEQWVAACEEIKKALDARLK